VNVSGASLAARSDGRAVFVGDEHGGIRVVDVERGAVVGRIDRVHASPITALALHKDDRHLATIGADRRVRVTDFVTGRCIFELPEEDCVDAPISVAFSPRGDRLYVGTAGGAVLVADVRPD
jgi:WD40 repeat protein